jgi:2-oxo-3-hexenedioate decarboxylase
MKADVKHGALSAATLRDIAAEAAAAFENGGPQIQPFSARHPGVTMDDAYRITALANGIRVAGGYKPIGRKIGFTNRRIWPEYGVSAPNWGYVTDRTLHDLAKTQSLPAVDFVEPKIEPEIMFGLGAAPSPEMDEAGLLDCIGWVALGYEIVQSIYPKWKFAAADTAAANAMHGALLIGERHSIAPRKREWLRELADFKIELLCGGKVRDHGEAANVLDGPLRVLAYLADMLSRDPHNPPLTAGEIISTGTVTRALPVKPGETWTTKLRSIALEGVTLRFC